MKLLTKIFVVFLSVVTSGCASYLKLPDSENEQFSRELAFLMRGKSGFVYTVKKGDTLWSIAHRHGIEVNYLIKENPKIISDMTNLKIGQKLFIPTISEKEQPFSEAIKAEGAFIWPLRGKILENLATSGINIKASYEQAVKAVKSGRVGFVSQSFEGYGKVVIIKHADGFISFYGHNSEILVKHGETVRQGQVISRAGKTGRADQPQLHFKLFKNDVPVKPLNYLP